MQTITMNFDLMSTDYDYGFGTVVTHTFRSRTERSIGPQVAEIEGTLTVRGIDLKPGQRIKAEFTIIDA